MKVLLAFIGFLAAIVGTVQCLHDRNPICYLPKSKGHCKGHRIMWAFSSDDNECGTFIYSNCGGNANRFDSKELCEISCSRYTRTRPFALFHK